MHARVTATSFAASSMISATTRRQIRERASSCCVLIVTRLKQTSSKQYVQRAFLLPAPRNDGGAGVFVRLREPISGRRVTIGQDSGRQSDEGLGCDDRRLGASSLHADRQRRDAAPQVLVWRPGFKGRGGIGILPLGVWPSEKQIHATAPFFFPLLTPHPQSSLYHLPPAPQPASSYPHACLSRQFHLQKPQISRATADKMVSGALSPRLRNRND